jgi:ribosomal protein S18 acetylase RimI-like enzyme
MIVVREMADGDRDGIEAIDTSFQTTSVFDVVVTPRKLELVERTLDKPLVKRYPMADAFSAWASWDTGFVALDGDKIVGFAGVEYEAWHRRLVLWHLYVAPEWRRRGVGRALLTHIEQYGRRRKAERVWLETTSVNVPGLLAYERLGYTLCGCDVTMYDALPYSNEAALFLAKSLTVR